MPSRGEVETVINWTGEDERAVVYSLMPRIWRLCERAEGELLRTGSREGKVAWKEYAVDIAAIRIRAPKRRKVSEEERSRRAEWLRQVRKGQVPVGIPNEVTSKAEPNGEAAGSGPLLPSRETWNEGSHCYAEPHTSDGNKAGA